MVTVRVSEQNTFPFTRKISGFAQPLHQQALASENLLNGVLTVCLIHNDKGRVVGGGTFRRISLTGGGWGVALQKGNQGSTQCTTVSHWVALSVRGGGGEGDDGHCPSE